MPMVAALGYGTSQPLDAHHSARFKSHQRACLV